MDDDDLADTVIGMGIDTDTVIGTGIDTGTGTGIRVPAAGNPRVVNRHDVDADTVVRPVGPRSDATAATADPPARETPQGKYRVSINGAPPIILDVPHLLGRNPRVPRVVTGASPKLVVLDSPRGEVSGTHIELTQVGSSIVVTDLRSTNGTSVVLPGARPTLMRSGDSIVAVPGTLIELGDENRVEILPPSRLAPHSSQSGLGGYPEGEHEAGESER